MNHTPEQARAITAIGAHICVDAGAGSGKTRVLVDRIIHLIEQQHAALAEIAAITFTDKAAIELKDRLRAACRAKAAVHDAQVMSYWRGIERQIDTARIGTIHSFCGGLLREHALALGLDPDFSVLTEAESAMLRQEVIVESVHSLLDREDAAAHRAAIEFGMPALKHTLGMLLARSDLMERVRETIPHTSADELRDCWRTLVAAENERRLLGAARSPELYKFTAELRGFEGCCEKTTDGREVLRLAMLEALTHILGSDDTEAIHEGLNTLATLKPGSPRAANWISEETFAAIKQTQDSIKKFAEDHLPTPFNEEIEGPAAALTVDLMHVYAQTAASFGESKRARAAMDFTDMIMNALDMLRGNERLRRQTARSIKYLLIDEFQDTDKVQLEIANLLKARPDAPGAELFIVGDAKQSIYNFRGAEVEVFVEAKAASDEVIPLSKNFRSLPNTLNFVNTFFEETQLLAVGGIEYAALEHHREFAGQPRVEFLLPGEAVEKESATEGRRREADLIASRIEEMCGGPQPARVFDKAVEDFRPARFSDVAILFRSTASRYIYEEALRRRRIPFNVVAGAGFYERQEISDFINLLKTVADPFDELALLGFLRSPMGALSDESIMRLCLETSLLQAFAGDAALDDPVEGDRLARAREIIANLRERMDQPLSAFLRHALAETGHEAMLLSQYHGVQKASNLRKLFDQAAAYSRMEPPRLRSFLRYLDDAASRELREGDAPLFTGGDGSVTLMTIHKAKGLEFPIVVVADTARNASRNTSWNRAAVHRDWGVAVTLTGPDGERLTPAVAQIIARVQRLEDEAEQARVLYVALTRAQDWLLISGARAKGSSDWLSHFDNAYDIAAFSDGDVIQRDGWAAVVRRAPTETAHAKMTPAVADTPVDPAQWQARMNPVPEDAARRIHLSVSALLDTGEDGHPAEFAAAFQSHMNPLKRGQVVHRLFERWDIQRGMDPPIGAVIREFSAGFPDRAHIEQDLHGIAERFRQSPLEARIRNATRMDKEVPFLLAVNGRTVSGVIDAILDDALIIDYKTGRRRPELHTRYERQVSLYAAAMRALRGITIGEALLYYVDTGELHPIALTPALIGEALAHAEAALQHPSPIHAAV